MSLEANQAAAEHLGYALREAAAGNTHWLDQIQLRGATPDVLDDRRRRIREAAARLARLGAAGVRTDRHVGRYYAELLPWLAPSW